MRSIAHLISVGLACILVALSTAGIYVAHTAADIGGQLNRDQNLKGLYLRLALAVEKQSELQLTYDIAPSSSLRRRFTVASSTVTAQLHTLARVSEIGVEVQRRASLETSQGRYLPAVKQYFARNGGAPFRRSPSSHRSRSRFQ